MTGQHEKDALAPLAGDSAAGDASPVIGFMCRTDFDHELGAAVDGVGVYPSMEALRAHRPCVAQCGIVRVRVTLDAVVEAGQGWD